MYLFEHVELALLRHLEYRKVRAELETYSEHELNADLRLNRSDIPELAAEAADERVAAFVRAHPEYRAARARDRHPLLGRRRGTPVTPRGGTFPWRGTRVVGDRSTQPILEFRRPDHDCSTTS